jgi:hypothetical protein
MNFVGRENEKKTLIRELQLGKNIVLGGKFGIGRTSLAKEIAEQPGEQRQFVFVDFSQTPGKISKKLMKELHISSRLKKTGKEMSYKSMRYRIANMVSKKGIKTVIVLDNIARITAPKKLFLRHLILERHFQFIAIVEHFLPSINLFELKAQLMPATTIMLRNLEDIDVENILKMHSNQCNLNWTKDHIHNLAALTGGYPLGIVECLKKKTARTPL